MKKDIQKIIEENLPKQVGEVLQQRLVKVEKIEIENKNLLVQLQERKDKERELRKQLEELKAYKSKESYLNKLKEDLLEKERNLEVEKLKYQLQSEKDKTQHSKEIALGLVRNLEYRSNIYKNTNGSDYDSQTCFSRSNNLTISEDEHKKIE